MKAVLHPLIRSICIITVWLLCIRQLYLDFNYISFFDVAFTALVVLASIFSLLSFLVDYSNYKQKKQPVAFLSSFISLMCIAALLINSQYLKRQDKTATVLYASATFNGLNTLTLDFRENGTYKCQKNVFMVSSYITRGKYTMKDSVIYLDTANMYGLIKTNELQLKTIPKAKPSNNRTLLGSLFQSPNIDTFPETYLIQMHPYPDSLSPAIRFRVQNYMLGFHQ